MDRFVVGLSAIVQGASHSDARSVRIGLGSIEAWDLIDAIEAIVQIVPASLVAEEAQRVTRVTLDIIKPLLLLLGQIEKGHQGPTGLLADEELLSHLVPFRMADEILKDNLSIALHQRMSRVFVCANELTSDLAIAFTESVK